MLEHPNYHIVLFDTFDYVKDDSCPYFTHCIDENYEIRIESIYGSIFVSLYKNCHLVGKKFSFDISGFFSHYEMWESIALSCEFFLKEAYLNRHRVLH